MKKKARMFVVKHAGYPFDVFVAVGASDAKVAKRHKRLGRPLSEDDAAIVAFEAGKREKGRTIMLGTSNRIILRLQKWDGSPEDFGHLAHEVFHSVEFLMLRVGITLTRESAEAFAYAIGNLTRLIVMKLG